MRKSSITLTILLVLFLFVIPVLAATIDGDFSDWAGLPGSIDDGGVDDWGSPSDSDITEYRADSDANGLFLLMGWDDTSFNPSGSRAGITVKGADGNYYRIYSTMKKNPAVASLDGVSIGSCGADPTCGSETPVCSGTACTNAAIASTAQWPDPFAPHPASNCSDLTPDCTIYDAASEMYVPWDLIGGMPANGQFVYLTYGSYPSGSGQAPKDYNGAGLCCRNTGGTFSCYKCTPTAVDLVDVQASSMAYPSVWVLLLAAGLVAVLSGLYLRKRTGSAD